MGLSAQVYSAAEARDAKEFDFWLSVKYAKDRTTAQLLAREFQTAWPLSALLPGVEQVLFEHARNEGDQVAALRHAQRSIALNPNNPPLHLFLAEYETATGKASQHLADARRLLETFPPPPTMELSAWKQIKNNWRAQALEVEAIHALRAGATPQKIIPLLETAQSLRPQPDARTSLRLARAKRASGDLSGAATEYRKAIQYGEAAAAKLAQTELDALRAASPNP